MMFANKQHVHFIGIGGIGMSGIAEILLNLGHSVSGSDLRTSPITARLSQMGASIYSGHAASNINGATVVVTSSAVHATNPEIIAARALKIPVIPRAEMLAELMRLKFGIAVAGMHGKTTTTSMVAAVLAAGDLDPTVVVGGRVDALGSNARMGRSEFLVAEADESDRSFLKLSPILAVVTNLDREHMDCYRDMEDVEEAFLTFLNKVPFYGAATICVDDARLAALGARAHRRIYTYGVKEDADYRLEVLPKAPDCHASFLVHVKKGAEHETMGPFALSVPGHHNILNATAAVAIAHQLHVPAEKIATGLASFRGVDRRFQMRGLERGVAVVDDYGHHPTEIRATLAAARECGYNHIHVIFQPHRYSRTKDQFTEFTGAFADADSLIVLPIYAASEEPIPGISGQTLAAAVIHPKAEYAEDFPAAVARAVAVATEGDLILTLGAGNVHQLAPMILDALRA